MAFRRSVDKLIDFRSQVQLSQTWPVPDDHVIMFISFLYIGNFTLSTIKSHISAFSICSLCKWVATPNRYFFFHKKWRNNSRMDGRLPITPALLQRLISCLPLICMSSDEVLLFRAALFLPFFCFQELGSLLEQLTIKLKILSNC